MNKPPIHLANIRKLRGLSQRDLAAMINMDAATVQRAEVGHKSAKLETYIACAEALGITLSDIFGEKLEPEERDLINVFRSVPQEKRATFRNLLDLARGPLDPKDQ